MTDPWSSRLSEYLDGELDAATRSAVQRHVRSCAACREELAGLQRVVDRLDRDVPDGLPRDLWPALESRLPAIEREQPDLPVIPGSRPAPVSWAPMAAVAALLFLGIVWLGGRWESEPVNVAGGDLPVAAVSDRAVETPGAGFPSSDPVTRNVDVAASWSQLIDEAELPAEVEAAVRQDLEAFDRAFREVTVALEEAPGDAELERYLIHMLSAKASYLMHVRKSLETLS